MTRTTSIKTYSELILLPTFEERFEYLRLDGVVGKETFGYDRYLNQILYTSDEWRHFRDTIIVRDNGCNLACAGFDLYSRITVHHINPITVEDVVKRNPKVFDPENVVTTCHNTHMAIHYGDKELIMVVPVERRPGDTCPWR